MLSLVKKNEPQVQVIPAPRQTPMAHSHYKHPSDVGQFFDQIEEGDSAEYEMIQRISINKKSKFSLFSFIILLVCLGMGGFLAITFTKFALTGGV